MQSCSPYRKTERETLADVRVEYGVMAKQVRAETDGRSNQMISAGDRVWVWGERRRAHLGRRDRRCLVRRWLGDGSSLL